MSRDQGTEKTAAELEEALAQLPELLTHSLNRGELMFAHTHRSFRTASLLNNRHAGCEVATNSLMSRV